ncbi:MAG TPA: helix-turn-helix domain-containing protein [Vicinamibacterales bacterium]|nr:helix-turn-helix domain-containing protein [Vicinamibacterales bacterium]
MRYAEFLPSPQLSTLVERFWLLEGVASGAADVILPDGRVELIFHYRGSFWRHGAGIDPVRQPASLLVGQMLAPVVLAPAGYAGIAAIKLRPEAARSLLRFSLREVSGRFEDLDLIFPTAARLREQLAAASSDGARIAALEDWLRRIHATPPGIELAGAVKTMLQSRGRTSVVELSTVTGLGVRRMERQFHDAVGLTPKAFARIVRLQAALRRIRDGTPLSDVALACGYYDQAHMTRDFRQLAAMSPGAWQRHAGELAPLFVSPSSPAEAPACA